MALRDCGWIQLYAADNQEAVDLHVQAFRIAEALSLPVMVCMDGFVLTHAFEPLEVPAQEQVDAFLPEFSPRQVLDPDEPMTIGAMVGPEAFTEVRYLAHAKQLQALEADPSRRRRFPQQIRALLGRAARALPQRPREDRDRDAGIRLRHACRGRRRAARARGVDRGGRAEVLPTVSSTRAARGRCTAPNG